MLDHSHYMRRIYDLLETTFKHRHHVGIGMDLDALQREIGTVEQLKFFFGIEMLAQN